MHAIGFGPTLGLRAARTRGTPSFDFTSGVLPPGVAVSRGSAGRAYDAAGFAGLVAPDTARLDYHPATLAFRGLLIEPAATNLFERSDALDNAYWTSTTGLMRSANVAASPISASATAERLTKEVANSYGFLRREASFAAATYTLSAFVKAESARYFGIRFVGGSGSAGYAVFDANGGAFVITTGYAAGAETLPGGWFRIWASRVYAAGEASGTGYFGIALTDAAGNELWTPAGAMTALATGLQLETGATPTSHVATTSAAATRNADVVSLDWASRGVADGAITVRYSFDDGSSQDVATIVAAGKSTVPTGLNRRWITRAALL